MALGQGSGDHAGHKATGQALTPGPQSCDTQPGRQRGLGPRAELAADPKQEGSPPCSLLALRSLLPMGPTTHGCPPTGLAPDQGLAENF